jgi:hypothetical protein
MKLFSDEKIKTKIHIGRETPDSTGKERIIELKLPVVNIR